MTHKPPKMFFVLITSVITTIAFLSMFSQPVKATQTGQKKQTHVVILGTGTPNAEADRAGPAVAVIVNKKAYLVDFGPGVVRQASAAYEKGVKALHPAAINFVFATHLHSDHTAGYADLILTPAVIGRTRPLEVFGPDGIKDMTDHILKAYKKDIDVRLSGLEPANQRGYQINTHEVKPGLIFQDDRVKVTAFRVNHGSWDEAYGFRFETPDRTVVISGDTAPYEDMTTDYNKADVLVHEVYSKAGLELRDLEWQAYHGSFHTSGVELGEIAAKVKPGILVLYHQLLWGQKREGIIKEIRQTYSGKLADADDLDIF